MALADTAAPSDEASPTSLRLVRDADDSVRMDRRKRQAAKTTNKVVRPTLFLKTAMQEPATFSAAGGLVVAFSQPGPQRTTANEDAAAIIPVSDRTVVLAVADGVGGMKSGDRASASAIRALRRALENAQGASCLRTSILDGIERANETILKHHSGSATTMSVVEISDGYMRPYHVGDSIILQIGGRGEIKWSALLHAPVSYAVEAGVMSEEQAMLHPERNIISNAIGDRDMRIEIGPRRKLAAKDTVVVATDGLCDNLSSAEIADAVRRSPLEGKVAQMLAVAQDRMQLAIDGKLDHTLIPGKPDDLTALVYRTERRQRKAAKPKTKPVVAETEPISDQDIQSLVAKHQT